MQVQTNSSSPFYNPYASSAPQESETKSATEQNQLRSEFITVSAQLSPAEKRLYNAHMYTQNYEAAKEIIAIGFMRTTALDQTDEPKRLLDLKA